MEKNNLYSYSAASTFPLKLLFHPDLLLSCRNEHKVIPLHLQLNPTNRCNFDCPICSCSARDKSLEMSLKDIRKLMVMFKVCGGKAVTITGGGDPVMHEDFQDIIKNIAYLGIDIGLVSNGTLMDKLDPVLDLITWFRISSSDHLPSQLKSIKSSIPEWSARISKSVKEHPDVDFAFSHVVTEKTNLTRKWRDFKYVANLVKFAVKHNFTHVRLVNDIFNADDLVETMADLHEYLVDFAHLDVSKVNFQARSDWTKGFNPCYISLLKTVVDARGDLFPCCGVQYALKKPTRDYEKSMRMGFWTDFKNIVDNQKFFDGSVCDKCYYAGYNIFLDVLLNGLKHENFA